MLNILGGWFSFKVYRNFQTALKVKDTPTSKISSAAQGLVKLDGYAWPSKRISAPVSESPVVYYECEVSKGQVDSAPLIAVKKSTTPFFLVDRSGAVQISLENEQVEFRFSKTFEYRWSDLAPAKQSSVKNLFDANERWKMEKDWSDLVVNITVREWLIVEGSQITTLGNFSSSLSHNLADVRPATGLADFIAKISENHDRDRAKDDKEISVYGRMQAKNSDKIIVADCRQEKLANNIGGAIQYYLWIVGSILLVILADIHFISKFLSGK